MIRYFCDRCEKELGTDKDKPFVRYADDYVLSVIVLKDGHPAGHICHTCVGDMIVTGNAEPPKQPVATLQPAEERLQAEVENATSRFVSSLPGDRPNPRQG